MMTAGQLVDDLKAEGASRSSKVRILYEDGFVSDILMVEADDDGIIYLKVEDAG